MYELGREAVLQALRYEFRRADGAAADHRCLSSTRAVTADRDHLRFSADESALGLAKQWRPLAETRSTQDTS